MGEETLEATARALVAPGKGILAADENQRVAQFVGLDDGKRAAARAEA